MNDDRMLELTPEEAARVHGGYEVARTSDSFRYQGTFGLWSPPVYATPIQLPISS